jgi:regulator of protease activity HflC (stomatin/prohibitin superfamily)
MGNIIGVIIWIIVIYIIVKKIMQVIAQQSNDPNVIRVAQNPFHAFFEKMKFASKKTQSTKSSNYKNMNNFTGKIWWIIGGIALVIIALNILVVIPAGETGVRTLFGKVQERELSSGLHIINPLEHVERMTIRTEEYTMSVAQGEGQKVGSDQITALTNEGLQVDLDITVFYHLDEQSASEVYRQLGLNYQEKIIRPEIRSAIREVVARYNAKDIYSDRRDDVAQEIRERLEQTINPRGIIVEQVLLRNVVLPSGLAKSIQEKLQAEQESQRYEFVLQKEEKEAERKRLEAAGQRDAQAIINESLSAKYLQYLYIKELKDRQGTIYVPTGQDGLPIFKSVE